MPKLLLDTNCLIDLDEDRQPRAGHLREIIALQGEETLLSVAAISASENPKGDLPPKSWSDFEQLLARVGIPDIEVLNPMAYFDVSFFGHALWVGPPMQELEREVHEALAPEVAMDDRSDLRRWRNVKCDVQLVWCALWHGVDVLITGDGKLRQRAGGAFGDRDLEFLSPKEFTAQASPESKS
jgi:hypothetical protein